MDMTRHDKLSRNLITIDICHKNTYDQKSVIFFLGVILPLSWHGLNYHFAFFESYALTQHVWQVVGSLQRRILSDAHH